MPHLSPITWTIVPIIFWLSLITYMSINWWHTHPSLNLSSSEFKPLSSSPWNWS